MTRGRTELRAWITRTKMARKEAADYLEISGPYLCQLLLGERQPSAALMLRIEQKTGVAMRAWLDKVAVADQQANSLNDKSSICNKQQLKRVS